VKHDDPDAALRDFEQLLASTGIERGLIGPREADRLWERHILNCAVVARDQTMIPLDATVVDVGSGAGLPGLVWAIQRRDIHVTIVESLLRRTNFLNEAVVEFGLQDRVTVIRARAEDVSNVSADIATARAVAPLTRLLPWLRPLAKTPGAILALKGAAAPAEIRDARKIAIALQVAPAEIISVGEGVIDPPTTVVRYRCLRS